MVKRLQYEQDEALSSSARPPENPTPEEAKLSEAETRRREREYRDRGQAFGSNNNRGRRS